MVFPKSLSKPLKIIAFIVLFVLSLTKKDKCFFVSPTHFGFIILTLLIKNFGLEFDTP